MNHPNVNQPPPCRGKTPAGFSLPEVTMAVGIAAMAIVLLLGLVPSGLNSIRDAGNALAEARIFQQVVGEIQSANWGNATGGSYTLLSNYDGSKRFFDDQGTPLDETASNSLRLSYVARITLNRDGVAAVPGGAPSNNMVSVTIDIANVPDPSFSFPNNIPYSSRTLLVTRQY